MCEGVLVCVVYVGYTENNVDADGAIEKALNLAIDNF